ncbi:Gfo/Idh/MocA family protein [Ileibacterium valens]|uniref:Gfo/Idh/MocA family protein n=1 Tax=Ileibacterium valens TaxID=1862668 RepID=UPI00235687BA|nr:Gfo/Idh/MocA family oxidoreductase [Ileibacterium valens]
MKLGTIGSGAIVDNMFHAIKDIDGIEVEAVYSRNLGKAKEFAAKHQVKKYYDNLDDLFADDSIDTIYIATPNTLHYPQAKKALEAGKNVVLEKPFTTTLEQAKDLFETAEDNGVMIFEAITNIHTPNFGLLKDNLEMAGPLKNVMLNFSQYSSRYDRYRKKEISNAFNPEFDGGALTDINIYNIHLANGLFGKPEHITYYPNLGFNGVDTSGILIMEYPDFTVTAIGAKDCSADYEFLLEGEDGTFKISKASSGVMALVDFIPVKKDKDDEDIRISIEQGPHMSYEFMDFLVALNENDQEMYQKYKKETLDAMEMLMEAKKFRDKKAAARLNA